MTDKIPKFAYVLGVDPGTTTGLAIIRLTVANNGKPELVWQNQLSWQDACGAIEHKVKTLSQFRDRTQRVVTVELYTINAQTAQRGQAGANDAIGITGVVRRECFKAGIEFRNNQQASAAKTLVSDDTLKRIDLYVRGNKHANDAIRHAVYLAVKNKWMAPRWLAAGLM